MSAPVVLITGANGRIGQGLCRAFADSGWQVLATDRDESGAGDVEHYVAMDLLQAVRDADYREEHLTALRDLGRGRLDCLINNAALQHTGALDALSDASIADSFDVNALAPMLLTRDLAPELRKARGNVINVLSIHAALTKPGFAAYAASKAALTGLTRALAIDLAPEIRVNGIAPAAIATPMLEAGFENAEKLAELEAFHPAGTIGTPNDVADVALFLATSRSRFLTGTIVGLDGGIASRLHDPA